MSHVALAGMYIHAQDYGGDNGKPMLMTFNEFSFAFVCVALYKYPCPYWPMHLRVMKFLESCKQQGTLQGGAKPMSVFSTNDPKGSAPIDVTATFGRRVSDASEMAGKRRPRAPSIVLVPSPLITPVCDPPETALDDDGDHGHHDGHHGQKSPRGKDGRHGSPKHEPPRHTRSSSGVGQILRELAGTIDLTSIMDLTATI